MTERFDIFRFVGGQIQQLREAKAPRCSQGALGLEAMHHTKKGKRKGISAATISRIENGTQETTTTMLKAIAAALEVRLEMLFPGRPIPVVTERQLDIWESPKDFHTLYAMAKEMEISQSMDPDCFFVKVTNYDGYGSVLPYDLVLVEPNAEIDTGDLCLAKFFKKLDVPESKRFPHPPSLSDQLPKWMLIGRAYRDTHRLILIPTSMNYRPVLISTLEAEHHAIYKISMICRRL